MNSFSRDVQSSISNLPFFTASIRYKRPTAQQSTTGELQATQTNDLDEQWVTLYPKKDGKDLIATLDTSFSSEFQVTITKLHGNNSRNQVTLPKYHKPKSMSWWLVMTSGEELIAMKRIGVLTGQETVVSMNFQWPANAQPNNGITMHLKSDSIMGLDLSILLH